MRELIQAGAFFDALEPAEKMALCETLAADIYFLDDSQQQEIVVLFDKIHPQLGHLVRVRNNFTI